MANDTSNSRTTTADAKRTNARSTTTTPGMASVASGSPSVTAELLTSKQAAALCGIGERTLWRWSRSGIAPKPLKIGCGLRAATRYRRRDLLIWICNGCGPIDSVGVEQESLQGIAEELAGGMGE